MKTPPHPSPTQTGDTPSPAGGEGKPVSLRDPSLLMPWKALIFDWDGTLMDSESRIVNCLRASSLQLGYPDQTNEAYKNVIGLGLREAMRALHAGVDESRIDELIQAYRQEYLFRNDTPCQLFDGVPALLQQLEENGYFLAIATGKGREGLDQVLQETGLHARFHVTRCASETRSKPHPQMLEEILDVLGLHSHEALMIGDTEYDLEMARNIGMASLAVSYGVHSLDRLIQHQPVGHLDTIAELPDFLLNFASRQTG